MTSSQQLTIIEGGESAVVTLEANMPPRFICTAIVNPGEECIIKIEAAFEEHVERACTFNNSFSLLQAVLGWNGPLNNAFCGLRVTQDSWDDDLTIPIRAKVNTTQLSF